MIDYFICLLWIAGIVFAPFYFIDSVVSDDTKKRLADGLRSNPHALDELPQIAASLFERIFGPSHFSFRCLGASVAASLIFLTLFFVLRALLFIVVYDGGDWLSYVEQEVQYLSFKEVDISIGISIAANLLLDYFGLLKTRVIISFLLRRKNVVIGGFLILVVDLIVSLAIFQTFYFIFALTGFVTSFGYGKLLLPGGDAYSMGMMIEAFIIFNFATSRHYPSGTALNFLTHSHAIAIFLISSLVPITLVSVFFYASVAPSLWLWLFFLAAAVSRLIAPSWPSALDVLNFEKAPIKVLGVIASALVVLFITFALAVLAIVAVTLSALLK